MHRQFLDRAIPSSRSRQLFANNDYYKNERENRASKIITTTPASSVAYSLVTWKQETYVNIVVVSKSMTGDCIIPLSQLSLI